MRMWYAGVITATCNSYAPDAVYVEIGVARGRSLKRVARRLCKEVHGVDPDPSAGDHVPDGVRFWNMTSDDFFAAYDGLPPTVVFVDGDHAMEQALRDFENSLALLATGGAIFLHDTWPRNDADTSEDRCGTVWQLAEEIGARADLESYSWPVYPGLTIVRRRGEGFGGSGLRDSASRGG